MPARTIVLAASVLALSLVFNLAATLCASAPRPDSADDADEPAHHRKRAGAHEPAPVLGEHPARDLARRDQSTDNSDPQSQIAYEVFLNGEFDDATIGYGSTITDCRGEAQNTISNEIVFC